MLKNLALIALIGALIGGGCSNVNRGTGQPSAEQVANGGMIEVKNDDAAMNAALAKGNASLPQFVAALKNPRPTQSDFALYARFTENGQNEYLWLEPVKLSGADFQGRVNNEPGMLKQVKLGQIVTVAARDIGDWMFVENGKLVGGETSRVLRAQMSEKERAEFDKSLPYRFN